MTVKIITFTLVISGLSLTSCTNSNKYNSVDSVHDSLTIKQSNNMKSHISIFEIPATDISRAIDFYQNILEINIEKMEMPDMQMGIMPYKDQMVTGIIIQAEGYNPSPDGATIYLNGGDNLQVILDKIEKMEGKFLFQKHRTQMKTGTLLYSLIQKEINSGFIHQTKI